MQTFVPLANGFAECARVLDRQRLGQQRVEALQIFNALQSTTHGWRNHPAVTMWRGHEIALCAYGLAMCHEWASRGYTDNLGRNFADRIKQLSGGSLDEVIAKLVYPAWWGDDRIHSSHRAALLCKDRKHYSQFGWQEQPVLNYVWPSQIGY